MAIFKADKFSLGDSIEGKQDMQTVSESSTGFIKKMMENTGASRGKANVLRTHAKVASISALFGVNAEDAAALVASVALDTAREMGYDTTEQNAELDRILPTLSRASSDAVLSYAQNALVNMGRVRDAWTNTENSAKTIAKSLASVSKNKVLSRYVGAYQDFEEDAHTSINMSSVGAIARILPEVSRFDFGCGQKKALQFCAATIANGFSKHVENIVGGKIKDIKPGHRVMLMNAFYRTSAEIFLACWKDEARRTRVGIKKARAAGLGDGEIAEAVKNRIKLVETAFLDRLNFIVECGIQENPVAKMVKQVIPQGAKP